MFAVNYFIDSVQSGKKFFVSSFVTNENVRNALNNFVDAQTNFVKQIYQTGEVIQKEIKNTL